MNDKEFLINFGKRLQSLRKSQGLSQETLAELTELHPTHISKMERGVVNASIVNLHRISRTLNMTLSEVLNIPSKKEGEKNLILQRIIALLRKQDSKSLKYIEKSITEFIKFTKW